MPANINEVEGLTLSQEDKPQTYNCVIDWNVFVNITSLLNH